MRFKPALGVTIVAALALTMCSCGALIGKNIITVDADLPPDFPDAGFSHAAFENLLQSYVDADGNVTYDDWYASADDVAALDSYLTAVSRFSPENAPHRFVSSNDELAYWLYSYNAYVIKSILNRWPLDSVTDVKAPVEIVKGFGFFYSQRFIFGEQEYNLYDVENKKIRERFQDARIHFVLNCGSDSCPILRPELPTGDALEPFLSSAAADFVSDANNVRINHGERSVVLNEIFDWFEKDFINDLRQRGLPSGNGLIDYISNVAPPDMRDDLSRAQDYKISFADYDWSINDTLDSH